MEALQWIWASEELFISHLSICYCAPATGEEGRYKLQPKSGCMTASLSAFIKIYTQNKLYVHYFFYWALVIANKCWACVYDEMAVSMERIIIILMC